MAQLTRRQADFVQGVEAGKNVFLSGSAGTGKSFAINEAVDRVIDGGRNVIKLAHQGISAVNIGGVTINRFLKIGLGKDPIEAYKERFLRNRTARGKRREGMAAARAIDVVMIDEISQVTEMQLQLLEFFFRVCRSPVVRGELQLYDINDKPWGGLQVIAVGDFCQTQPVEKQATKLFDTGIFKVTFDPPRGSTVLLTQVMRQEDAEEHAILERIRMGNTTQQDAIFLKGLVGKQLPDIGVKPIRLVPVNEKAREYNKAVYDLLEGPEDVYRASCRSVVKHASADSDADSDEEDGAAPGADALHYTQQLLLEKDADKMGYAKSDTYGSEMINDSIRVAHSTFISSPPVDHALCLKPKMPVMVTRNTEGFLPPDPETGDMPSVEMFNGMRGTYEGRDHATGNPIVTLENGNRVTIQMIDWKVKSKDPNEEDEMMSVSVMYRQIPLMHAAAISIHKSLGLTLTQVELDIGKRVFAFGQAYVGISRTKSLKNGLSLIEVDPSTIMADPACVEFYRRHEAMLSNGEEARERLLGFMKRRMAVGLEKYKHGIRREDDTRTFGTETDSWEEMAMEEVSDCIVYCAAAQLRREGPPRPEGQLDDNQAVLELVESGQNATIKRLATFWSTLDNKRPRRS